MFDLSFVNQKVVRSGRWGFSASICGKKDILWTGKGKIEAWPTLVILLVGLGFVFRLSHSLCYLSTSLSSIIAALYKLLFKPKFLSCFLSVILPSILILV